MEIKHVRSIAVIGAGRLGRRYIEGLTRIHVPIQLYVVDSNNKALDAVSDLLKHRLLADRFPHASLYTTLEGLPRTLDLAVLSTTADVRPTVARTLGETCRIEFMILEKLLSSTSEGLSQLRNLTLGRGGTWINYPRRAMTLYLDLKRILRRSSVKSVDVIGTDWAMASNSAHFVDLATWLSDQAPVSVDTSELLAWTASHRPGYDEVHGTIRLDYGDGLILQMTSLPSGTRGAPAPGVTVTINTTGGRFTVLEAAGQLVASNGTVLCQRNLELQSELTASLVGKILTDGQSELTLFDSGAEAYGVLLAALEKHFANSCDVPGKALCLT